MHWFCRIRAWFFFPNFWTTSNLLDLLLIEGISSADPIIYMNSENSGKAASPVTVGWFPKHKRHGSNGGKGSFDASNPRRVSSVTKEQNQRKGASTSPYALLLSLATGWGPRFMICLSSGTGSTAITLSDWGWPWRKAAFNYIKRLKLPSTAGNGLQEDHAWCSIERGRVSGNLFQLWVKVAQNNKTRLCFVGSWWFTWLVGNIFTCVYGFPS